MTDVGTLTPDKSSLWKELVRAARNKIDWDKVLEILETLGSQAVQGKATKKKGATLLHSACAQNSPLDVVQMLVKLWPDAVKVKTNYGDLPLHIACESNKSMEVIQFLVETWPDAVKEKTACDNLPLHVACQSNPSLELIQCGWSTCGPTLFKNEIGMEMRRLSWCHMAGSATKDPTRPRSADCSKY